MVRHIGEHERIDVHETEHRKERPAVQQGRGERRAVTSAPPDQSGKHQQGRGGKEPLPDDRGVDGPARVEKRQPGRPEQFAKIEPDDPAGKQATFHGAQGESIASRADLVGFKPRRPEAGRHAERKPR